MVNLAMQMIDTNQKRTITVTRAKNNAYDMKLAFKSNATFITCVSKTNNIFIDNAEILDIVITM